MKTEVLRAERLWVDSERTAGLRDFSITAFQGEIIGITGLVGSGIASVAGALSGRSRVEKGRIYIGNEPMELKNIAQAHEKGIYTITERPMVLPCLTLVENICIEEKNFRFGLMFPSKEQKQRVEQVIGELEIPIDCQTPAAELPIFWRHVIEIVRAFYMEARLLILDQISGGYTSQECGYLKQLLIRLKERKMSVLVLDTGYERLSALADTLLVMRNGRVEAVFENKDWRRETVQRVELGDYQIPDTGKTSFFQDQSETPLLRMEHISGNGFQDLCFHLNRGEILGFWEEEKGICENLYELLCGQGQIREGRAFLENRPLGLSGGRIHMIRQGIGFVDSWEKGIFPKLTLAENLTISSLDRFSRNLRINQKLERAVLLDLVDQLEIPQGDLKKRIEKLDGNTCFLVTIYRWLLKRTKVIVFHNVLAGSDIIIKDSMLKVINQIHSSDGGGIIFSSNKKELYELCDRVYVL